MAEPAIPANLQPVTYARRLGVWDASMVVVGGVIGSGIFRTASAIAKETTSSLELMLAWVIGGAGPQDLELPR